MMDLRFDRTLSSSGLRGPPSMTPANGCGGSGSNVATGWGVSRTRTLFSRTGAVGGGGNQGRRTLSPSEESLSNLFSCVAMAMVPRLRAFAILS